MAIGDNPVAQGFRRVVDLGRVEHGIGDAVKKTTEGQVLRNRFVVFRGMKFMQQAGEIFLAPGNL